MAFAGDSHRASTPSRSTSSNASSVDNGRFPACHQPIGSTDYQNNATIEDVEIQKILQRKSANALLETPKRNSNKTLINPESSSLDSTKRHLFTSDNTKISNYNHLTTNLNDSVEILKAKIRQNFSLSSADIANYYSPADSGGLLSGKNKTEMDGGVENNRGSLKRRCLFGGSYVEQQPPAKISKLADEPPSAGASTVTKKTKTRTAISVRTVPESKRLAIAAGIKRTNIYPLKSPFAKHVLKKQSAVEKTKKVSRAKPLKSPGQQGKSPSSVETKSPGTSPKKSKTSPKNSPVKKPTSSKKTAGAAKKPTSNKKKLETVVKKSPSKLKPAPKKPAVKVAAKKPTTKENKPKVTSRKVVKKPLSTPNKPKAVVKKVVKQVPSVKSPKTNTNATTTVSKAKAVKGKPTPKSPKKAVIKKPKNTKAVTSHKSPRKALSSKNAVTKTSTAKKAVAVKGSQKQLVASRPSRSSAKLIMNTTRTVTVSSTTLINVTQRKKRV